MVDPTLVAYHDHRSDIGAGVRSYRDKSAARPRLANPDREAIPFYDPGAVTVPVDMNPEDLFGRASLTGFEAIREHSGVLSTGELMAVSAPFTPPGGLGGAFYPQPLLMGRLAVDGRSLDLDGVDPMRYGANGSVSEAVGSPSLLDDGIADDYDEQFALYNGVANSLTTRSDVYAIWFVMHGYARDDVEGLRPQDPMTPSVARRYLIIVDRSNVRRAGDRARVLLFDELPL